MGFIISQIGDATFSDVTCLSPFIPRWNLNLKPSTRSLGVSPSTQTLNPQLFPHPRGN